MPVSLLERRRIEAEFARELLAQLVPEVGEERALKVLRATAAEQAERFGRQLAAASGEEKPGLDAVARVIPLWQQDGALEIEFLEQSPERLAFNVTRCRYAEMYHELGAPKLGEALSCQRDGRMCEGFNPDIRFDRTQTIMAGATHCDFRFSLPAARPVIHFYNLRDPYGEFSNFSRHPIFLAGKKWATSEHYFQAQKFVGTPHEEQVRLCKTPRQAADMGRDRKRPLRADWEAVKDDVMLDAIRAKFTQHADLKALLLGTGDAVLVEHTANDSYWGDGGDGSGKNRLGHLLMRLRTELTGA